MYKTDKIGVDSRIDGMIGELSHDIEAVKRAVEVRKEAYIDAFDAFMTASQAVVEAKRKLYETLDELDKIKQELHTLESIDAKLRKAKEDVDQAYDTWFEWQMS